jgi:integrase
MAREDFIMSWTTLVGSYLAQQRQLGYSLLSEGRYLLDFALFAEQQASELALTIELALCWANRAHSGSEMAIARRFGVLRPFSRYVCAHTIGSVVLPTHFLGPTHRRLPPFIFTELDLSQLMTAADKLIPINGLRPTTIKTLIGLLASTGLRPGEAVRLKRQDVSLHERQIIIHKSKGWLRRVIPISPSVVDALCAYTIFRDQLDPLDQSDAFFEFDNYRPLDIRAADYAFHVLRKATGLHSQVNGRQPRLYDLRHTFVCRRVIAWYKSGEDVDCRIAQLSRYLGHKKVSDTYWYLTAIPELMACAANKVAKYCAMGSAL